MFSRRPGRDWPTSVLTTTAEILRTVTPTTLSALVLIENDTATTQTAIADTIDRHQSTVSSHFQSLTLDTADIALIERSNHSYTLTDTGSEILDCVVATLEELGLDLETVDWESAADKEQIGDCLAPLYGSRSVEPFFVLNSLAARSGPGGLHSDPQTINIDKVNRDVKNRLEDTDTTPSNHQIRQIIDRFADQHALKCDDDHLILTEKGQQHAHLLQQVMAVVEDRIEIDQNGSSAATDSIEEAVLQMRRDRIATSWSLENDDPQLIDNSHFYRHLKRIDFLDRPADEWNSFRWMTLENVGTEPTTAAAHKESGENKITFTDLDPVAYLDGPDGQQLEVNNLTDHQPAFEQKVAFLFPQPLPPGERITIHYRLTWPNEIAHYSSQNQSISLTRYTHGVGELQFGIVDTADHVGIDCQKLVGDDDHLWESVSDTPDHFDVDDRPELAPLHGEGHDGYLYTIPSPKYPSYRICYTPVA